MDVSADELFYFDRMTAMLPVYALLKEKLQAQYADMTIKVAKTQIAFRNRYVFAVASLPQRKVKGWPAQYLLVSFGLAYQKVSPRIVQVVEAYPNRWTHHVLVRRADEIDAELMDWLRESYEFSMAKGR